MKETWKTSTSTQVDIYKKATALIVVSILFSQLCIASNPEVIFDSDKTRVLLSDEYTYYGIDFSNLVLVNSAKLHQGEIIKHEFCPAWLGAFDEQIEGKTLRGGLNAKTLHDERYPFQSDQYLKNDVKSIVNLYASALSIETLKLIISGYQLDNESGIGLSFIISEFNKKEEEAIGYITFFDIESRELFYVIKSHGEARGTGMTNHWYYGLYNAWNDYFLQKFRTEKRKARKAQ